MPAPGVDHPIVVGSPEFTADPHRHFAWLRRHAPVYRGQISYLPGQDAYLVSRHRVCAQVVTDPRIRRVVAEAPALPGSDALRFLTTSSMIYQDDPAHLRLRRLVSRAFTPRAVARLADRVEALIGDVLDTTWPGQEIDLQRSYARPIPVTVINEMVGVPATDRARFATALEPLFTGLASGDLVAASRRLDGLVDYLRGLLERVRTAPGEDILSDLVQVRDGSDRLSDNELIAMVFLLVMAGYETTYHLITNGVAALLSHPGQLALLQEQPELIGSAVEEILRYTGTVGGTEPTHAAEDIILDGVPIPRGGLVVPLLAAANRDPDVFSRPDEFDITRDPNPHLAFSRGTYFCLGAALARMQTRIALGSLFRRYPGTHLAVDPAELRPLPIPLLHRLPGLPVVLC